MTTTLSHSGLAVSLPRWEAVHDELKKLDASCAKRFKDGRYKDAFDYGVPPTEHKYISSVDLAAAYVLNADDIENAAEEVYAREGWLRPRSSRVSFCQNLAHLTGQSAAHILTGIEPVFESYLAEVFGALAVPKYPLMAKTDEDIQYIDSFLRVNPGLLYASLAISSPSLDAFGRAAAEEALHRDGIAIGSEVDDYLAAVAEWTGVENDYLAAVELARFCVLEDDVRQYAENGVSREYAAVIYQSSFAD